MTRMMRKGIVVGIALLCLFALHVESVGAEPAGVVATLKRGTINDEVAKLQTKLRDFGYYTDVIDGRFGVNTVDAVLRFQMDSNLEPTGIVEAKTWDALRNFRGASSVSRGKPDLRKAQMMIDFAKQYLGVPYVWAGRSPGGFDCSGFIYYVFDNMGVSVPRMADGQFEVGLPIPRNELQPGDLVFFSTYEPGPSHVGIYVGNEQFLHASSGAGHVTVTPMANPYHRDRYIGARRILK